MMPEVFNRIRSWPAFPLVPLLAFGLWVLDILSAGYFIRYWELRSLGQQLWQTAFLLRGESWWRLDPLLQAELISIVDITAASILTAMLIINSFFYCYLSFHKRWAWHYGISYCLSAAALGILTLMEGPSLGFFWESINVFTVVGYVLLGFFLWVRKNNFSQKGFRLKAKQNGE